MRRSKYDRTVCALAAFLCIAGSAAAAGAQTSGEPERFSATAVDTTGGGALAVEISITRWSTEAEQTRVMTALFEGGPDKLREALRKSPRVGYLRTTSTVGLDLRYAQRTVLPEGGESIMLLTERPIGFWEQTDRPLSIEYPFTVVQLTVNPDGQGKGTIVVAAKILGEGVTKTILIEDFGIKPVDLISLQREKP